MGDRNLAARLGTYLEGATLPASLESTLASLLDGARRKWPEVELDEDVFLRHLAERLSRENLEASLATLHGTDLFLACACLGNQPEALKAFDAHFLSEVGNFVSRVDPTATFADEVRQHLREKLFLTRPPKIAGYTGRGPLGGWLRVVAVRAALDLRRADQQMVTPGAALDMAAAPGADPELDYMKVRYRKEFAAAFENTIGSLSSDERNVLRLHYLDGMNIDQIGQVYRVHRATVARWIAASRKKIITEIEVLLRDRLRLQTGDFDSVMRLVESQLDLSIQRILQKTKG